MNGLNVGYVGILIQGFAFFVAVSILLGRIYFLTYFETLGIPTSAVRLNVINYSVISPDVAILGVGMTVLFVAYVWFSRQIRTSPDWNRIIVGAVLVGVGLGSKFWFLYWGDPPTYALGGFGSRMIMWSAMWIFGIVILISGIPRLPRLATDTAESTGLWRSLLPILYLVMVPALIMIVSGESATLGKWDAQKMLTEAPLARVEFAQSREDEAVRFNLDSGEDDSSNSDFRVILIGGNFVYLRPTNSDISMGEPTLQAFPTRDIVSITYVSESDD